MSLQLACHAAGISGRITAADGVTPLEGIEVQARPEENSWFGAFTDNQGRYSFSSLPAGSYRIRIEDNNLNNYIPEWYDNAATYATSTPLVLAETDVVTGVDASLVQGGRLIGNITADTGGAPLANIRVAAFRATNPSLSNWQEVKSRLSLGNGSYVLGGLEDGVYRLRFSDDAGDYAPEHHDNQIEFNDAGSIIISAGSFVTTNASLADASGIQGTVTAESGTNPLAGILVYAHRSNGSGSWNYVNQTVTQTNGSYDLKGLTAGDHRLEFYDPSGLHQREYYDDEPDFASATVINLDPGEVPVTRFDAALASAGGIAGTITDVSGAGIPNIYVYVYRYNTTALFWEFVEYGYTDGNGSYQAGGLPAGNYKVGTYDESRSYVDEYYNDKPDIVSANNVSVTVGSITGDIDFVLAESITGSISGTVRNTGGGRLAGIEVDLIRYNTVDDNWETLETTLTDGTGIYRFGTVEVGSCRLRFRDPAGNYATEFHSDKFTAESALEVVVTEDNETVVNAVLADAAGISGMVTNNAAAPVAGIAVNLFRLDGGTSEWVFLASKATEANGTYSFGSLPAGTFFVEFTDYSPSVTYAREYYNGKPTSNAADPLAVLAGQDLTGIDASLDLAGQISGTVRADADTNPIQFVNVIAYRLNEVNGNWDYVSGVSTNFSGVYSMQGLTPGSYRLEFNDVSGRYLREYHDNKPTLLLADSFVITPGGSTVIDASLATAGRIEGTVTREGSTTPLPNIVVTAYRVIAPGLFQYAFATTTGQFGTYSVGGLAAGTYWVTFDDPSGYHLPETYSNGTGLDTGTDIAVAAALPTTGIDAALIAGGRISGTVTNAVTQSALQGIGIYLYRYDGVAWQYQSYAETDSAGDYTSPPVPTGQYRVEFYDNSQSAYRGEYYNNTFNSEDATPVTVQALQTTEPINAALSPIDQSNTIAGTITNGTSAPLAGIHAQVFLLNVVSGRYEFRAEAISDSNGDYLIENLPTGLFKVRFIDRNNGAYAQQFFSGSITLNDATLLNLGTQASVTDVDASMEQARSISGTVRNGAGDGIAGVNVIVKRWEAVNNEWFSVNSTQTLAGLDAGTYTVGGLPDGIYRVEFSPSEGSGYYREFYDDVQTINGATDLFLYQFLGGTLTDIDAELSSTPPETVTPAMSAFRKTGPTAYESDFQGQPGTMYQLERSLTLLPGSWLPDGLPFEAQTGGDLLNMSSGEPRMFWRVREQ